MKFISRLICSDEWADQPSYGLITIDPEYAQTLLSRREQVRPLADFDLSFYGASWFSYCVDPFDYDDDQELSDELEQAEVVEAPDGFELPQPKEGEYGWRTDCETVVVQRSGVLFKFYAKHADTRFETNQLSWEQIEAATKEAPVAKA